jgi:hypothetical protein
MTYTRGAFGRELMGELEKGYDVIRLSRWAMSVYLKHCQESDAELDKEIMRIVAMEEGPQFEYSEEELRQIASDMQDEDRNGEAARFEN